MRSSRLTYSTDLKEYEEIYCPRKKYDVTKDLKFGQLKIYTPPESIKESNGSQQQKFTIKVFSIKKKANAKDFLSFLELLQDLQATIKKAFGMPYNIIKIQKIYKDPQEEKYFIIQKYYEGREKSLFQRVQDTKVKEIDALNILREVSRLYYTLIKDYEPDLNLFLNENLALKSPLYLENMFYWRSKEKKKGKLRRYKLKIDILDFLTKEDEILDQTLEDFHITSFKHLALRLLFEDKVQGKINEGDFLNQMAHAAENAVKRKEVGIISRNLINSLFNEKNSIKWSTIFQHPIFKIDIFISTNDFQAETWRIDPKRDKGITLDQFYPNKMDDYRESRYKNPNRSESEFGSKDESTQKRYIFPRREDQEDTINDRLSISGTEKLKNVNVHSTADQKDNLEEEKVAHLEEEEKEEKETQDPALEGFGNYSLLGV